jgi:hypothetical protein
MHFYWQLEAANGFIHPLHDKASAQSNKCPAKFQDVQN